MPSKRSKNPPWPGNKVPEFLICARRLSHDSNKSPARESAQTIKEKNMINHHDFVMSCS